MSGKGRLYMHTSTHVQLYS